MHPALRWAPGLVGQVLGRRWRLERLLGAGGMGAVFEAAHVSMGKRVALKLVAPELRTDAVFVERFQREARAAGALRIRGVVEVLDHDVDQTHGPFLVMELLAGETLGERLQRTRRLGPAEIVALGASLLETLSAVHARGIVHRDLKPGNVFLATGPDGREAVVILDFGISHAARAGHETRLTMMGSVLGTPRYMSPEQALAAPDVDARADLYGVGAILYACAAGCAPYAERAALEVSEALLAGPPRPLAQLAPDLPPALLAAIERALEHDRARRWPDAASMRAALLESIPRGGRAAPPVPSAPAPPASRGASPWAWAVVGAGVVIAIAGAGALGYALTRTSPGEAAGSGPQPGAGLGGVPMGVAPTFGGVVGAPVSFPPPPPALPIAFIGSAVPEPSLQGRQAPPVPFGPADLYARAAFDQACAELAAGRTAEARQRCEALMAQTPPGPEPAAARISALCQLLVADITVATLPEARRNGQLALTLQMAEAQTRYSEAMRSLRDLSWMQCATTRIAYANEAMGHYVQGVPHVRSQTFFGGAYDGYHGAAELPTFPDAPCRADALAGEARMRAYAGANRF